MVKPNGNEHPTHDIRLWNWRKSSTSTATWHDAGGSKSHTPSASRNVKSRFGSRIGEWSGRRSTKWPRWTPCRCIKCTLHSPMVITCRLWECTSLASSPTTLAQPECSTQKLNLIDMGFINNTKWVYVTIIENTDDKNVSKIDKLNSHSRFWKHMKIQIYQKLSG